MITIRIIDYTTIIISNYCTHLGELQPLLFRCFEVVHWVFLLEAHILLQNVGLQRHRESQGAHSFRKHGPKGRWQAQDLQPIASDLFRPLQLTSGSAVAAQLRSMPKAHHTQVGALTGCPTGVITMSCKTYEPSDKPSTITRGPSQDCQSGLSYGVGWNVDHFNL